MRPVYILISVRLIFFSFVTYVSNLDYVVVDSVVIDILCMKMFLGILENGNGTIA